MSTPLRYSVVVGLAVLGLHCGADSPTAPSAQVAQAGPITFGFEGVIGLSCFICDVGSDEFGTGVPPGTRLTGTFTFDPIFPPAPAEPNRVLYFGTIIEFTVGSESVSGVSFGLINIYNGPPSGNNVLACSNSPDCYIVIGNVFSSGTIAGVNINQFIWNVSASSSLFSDTSLPLVPFSLAASEIRNSRVCIGNCSGYNAPGGGGVEMLEGEITSLTLAP